MYIITGQVNRIMTYDLTWDVSYEPRKEKMQHHA